MSRIATLLLGHGSMAALTLARNLLLAQLLGLENYSIAITLSVLLAAVELTTSLGVPQLCVSHPNGGKHRWQHALHGVQVLRGLLGAALLLAVAHPIAHALSIPDQARFFASGACIPLILGLCHLDIFRAQRHRRHLPQVMSLAVPAAVSVAVIMGLKQALNSPNLMLFALSAQALATCILSHAFASRVYRIRFELTTLRQVLRYGLPIAANGALLFCVLHLEKLIAGQTLGLPALGLVAMGATLTLTPALIAARSFQAYHLPKLRRARDQRRSNLLLQACVTSAALSCATLALAWQILPMLAPSFAPLAPLLPLFVLVAAFRLPKSALATMALADGRTELPIWANLPRLCAAPIIWVTLSNGHGIVSLLMIACTAEALGFGLVTWLTFRRPTEGFSGAVARP